MWKEINNELIKEFKFSSYKKVLNFVNLVGVHADKVMHHPKMIVEFRKCTVSLTTHDEGNIITEKDRSFCVDVDDIFEKGSF